MRISLNQQQPFDDSIATATTVTQAIVSHSSYPSQSLSDSQYLGGLYGLLIGDALAVPYQGQAAEQLPASSDIQLRPPINFQRSYPHVAVGTWSDIGAQALCLLASLRHKGRLDLNDFARRLINWQHVGYMAVDFEVFAISSQTAASLQQRYRQLQQGIDLNQLYGQTPPADTSSEFSSAGSDASVIARVLPLVLWHQGSRQQLVHLAHQQAWLTHPQLPAQVGSALYSLWVKATIDQGDYQLAWSQAIDLLTELYKAMRLEQHLVALADYVRHTDCQNTATTGYDGSKSLRHAYHMQQYSSYERIVQAAISLADDPGATASMAGSIAGLRFGIEGIPPHWQHPLRGKTILYPFLPQPKTDINDYLVFNWNF